MSSDGNCAALVPKFSEDVRGRLHSVVDDLNGWESGLTDYETHFREEFEPKCDPHDPALSLKEKVELVALSALAQARQLAWAIVHATNSNSTPSLFLAARAHFEVTGFLAYLCWRLRQRDAEILSASDLEGFVARLLLGRRHGMETVPKEFAEDAKWIGVLDMIENDPRLKGMFRDSYEWLSEFCHPYSFSRFSTQTLQGGVMRFGRLPRVEPRDSIAVGYARISHIVFFRTYEEILVWTKKEK